MDTLLDTDELAIKEAAASFLAAEAPASVARAAEKAERKYSDSLWARVAELGWCGLCLPEDVGGQGAPLNWMGLLLEEVGRHVAPVPLHSVAVASLVISKFGSAAQREALSEVIAGRSIPTYLLQEEDGRWDVDPLAMSGRLDGDEIVLDGIKCFVDNASVADTFLVVFKAAPRGGVCAALVDARSAGIRVRPLVNTAKADQAVVEFSGVRVPRAALLGEWGRGEAIAESLMQFAAAFRASEMAGAAERATEFAVEYSKIRHAFGQPIGSFQSIQHLAADMRMAVDGTQLLAREALWRLDRGLDAALEVSQAKAFANQHCLAACRSAQQIHGGMGFMMEFDLHLWYRRVVTWSLSAGTTAEHRKIISRLLLDTPGRMRLDDCHPADAASAETLAA